jgi:hypothetical protein
MADKKPSRTEQRRQNDQKKAAAKAAKEGSILPPGHQRDKQGRTKPQ